MVGYKCYIPFVVFSALLSVETYAQTYTQPRKSELACTRCQVNGTIWLDQGKLDDWFAQVLSSDMVTKNILSSFVPLCRDLRGQQKTAPDTNKDLELQLTTSGIQCHVVRKLIVLHISAPTNCVLHCVLFHIAAISRSRAMRKALARWKLQ